MLETFAKAQKWFIKRRESEQSEATFILWFMLMPLFLGLMGLGIDVAAANYTKSSLQSALDTATQSAISASRNPPTGTTPQLTSDQARQLIYQIYDTNRYASGKAPFLKCQGPNGVPWTEGQTRVTPPSGCGFTLKAYGYTGANGRNAVNITITEYSSTTFLRFLGINTQKYEIASKAELTRSRG
jgi:Flp pilus assembly protein TadG